MTNGKRPMFQGELFGQVTSEIENEENSAELNSHSQATPANPATTDTPLAHYVRPKSFDDFKGHEEVFRRYKFLKGGKIPSLIIWGPPGTGKTTLAHLLAGRSGKELYPFSAVLAGIPELKKIIANALEMKKLFGKESIIFIDEIHRFNKAQQDALLPYVEAGDFVLIGATTENPRSSVNRALLSRLQTIELKRLKDEDLKLILKTANERSGIKASEEVIHFIATYSGGDARRGLNILGFLRDQEAGLSFEDTKKLILENARDYDKSGDRHYDVISAFIKSLRGSDPDSALLWLATMLDGGEDPVFIARRLIIFSSEDIGNADPMALLIATAALQAVQNIGMPEARINLAQAVTYLASTVKSNAAYMAMNEALEFVQNSGTPLVPDHLKNYPPPGAAPYQYPHSFPHHFVRQRYHEGTIPNFYRPTEIGREKNIKERLEELWRKK